MQIQMASVNQCVLIRATVIILNEGTVNKPKLSKVTLKNVSQNLCHRLPTLYAINIYSPNKHC